MDKVISFGKGIRRQPSIGEAGELSELVNLIPKNGELVNVKPMVKAKAPALASNEILLAVHKVQGLNNYIVVGEDSIKYYIQKESGWESVKIDELQVEEIPSVQIVGNTIVVFTQHSMHYLLWKNSEYVYLGDHLPELPITFGLQGEMVKTDDYSIDVEDIYVAPTEGVGNWNILSQNNKKIVTDKTLSKVNEFISEKSTKAGRFIYPFFVRYAYRLYDGTLTMHSAPSLMVCSSDLAPQCFITSINKSDMSHGRYNITSFKACIASVVHQLDYAVSRTSKIDDLSKWGDIVKSVDIFVSRPIMSYDQNGECGDIEETKNSDCYSICMNIGQKESTETYPLRYQKNAFSYLYGMTFSEGEFEMPKYRIMLPRRDEEELRKDFADNSLFYLLKSINIDDLKTQRTIIPISKNYLQALVSREVMDDDYISHDKLIPSSSNVYNSRLNIFNTKRELFRGFKSDTMQSYTDGYIYKYGDSASDINDVTLEVYVYYYIRQDGKDVVVKSDIGSIARDTPILWLYYPNRNAHKAVVEIRDLYIKIYEVQLEPHTFLNGSFYMSDWDGLNVKENITNIQPIETDDKTVNINNTVFTSEVYNPFIFPVSGSYTISTHGIIGLSTSAKALSQGQFGQFPLYAFCHDGIWALEILGDGKYKPAQPISRDVCNNPDSITQIDGAVVFTTDQGLKMIQGSDVILLSGNMDGHNVDEREYFREGFFASKNAGYASYDSLIRREMRDFGVILESCRIAYDYPNNMLRIFPKGSEEYPYAGKYYVFDMGSKEFSSVTDSGNVHAVIPDYPTSLVQKDTMVYTFANTSDNVALRDGLLLTRPIDFGEPFAMKKLHDMRMHYTKHNKDTKCRMVVFVSNDNRHWFELASLRQGSYKYYRFGVVTTMSDDDRLSGMAVRYDLNRTNKLR